MTPRESFLAALEGKQPSGHVPTFELIFYLTMELLGKVHPDHRSFPRWEQMSASEKRAQIADAGDVHIEVARRYGHSAIVVFDGDGWPDCRRPITEYIRKTTGREFALLWTGDTTLSIPEDGQSLERLVWRLADEPQKLKEEQDRLVDAYLERAADPEVRNLIDGFVLLRDYCTNTGPFLGPDRLREFVFPFLRRLIAGYRSLGYYTIKHCDGNIMPIIDDLLACRPHALHSLDPQGGVDLATVKAGWGGRVCLIGNVDCGLLQTGTDEQVVAAARTALRIGMPGGGYIFSTSNCVYTGMPLRRYDLMMDVWMREGRYPA
jgi:uroporphyrinogen decarboxylase